MTDENTTKREMGREQANTVWEDQEALVTSTGEAAPDPVKREMVQLVRPTPGGAELKETDTHTHGQKAEISLDLPSSHLSNAARNSALKELGLDIFCTREEEEERYSVVRIDHCYGCQDRTHHGAAEPQTQSHSICVFKARPTPPSGNIGQAQA